MAKHPVRKRGRGQNGGVIAFGSVIRLRHHTTNRYLVTGNRSYSHAGTSGQRQGRSLLLLLLKLLLHLLGSSAYNSMSSRR